MMISSEFLDRLRTANVSRVGRYGHPLHGKGAWNAMAWGCAIAGEVGEVCTLLADFEEGASAYMMGEELADVYIYTDLAAAFLGIRMGGYPTPSPRIPTPERLGLLLAREAGELCNLFKKWDRALPTDPEPRALIAEMSVRLGRVAGTLECLAIQFHINLAEAIAVKFNKSSVKYGHPERLHANH